MPSHTTAERVKKALTNKFGGFKKREIKEVKTRRRVQQEPTTATRGRAARIAISNARKRRRNIAGIASR